MEKSTGKSEAKKIYDFLNQLEIINNHPELNLKKLSVILHGMLLRLQHLDDNNEIMLASATKILHGAPEFYKAVKAYKKHPQNIISIRVYVRDQELTEDKSKALFTDDTVYYPVPNSSQIKSFEVRGEIVLDLFEYFSSDLKLSVLKELAERRENFTLPEITQAKYRLPLQGQFTETLYQYLTLINRKYLTFQQN